MNKTVKTALMVTGGIVITIVAGKFILSSIMTGLVIGVIGAAVYYGYKALLKSKTMSLKKAFTSNQTAANSFEKMSEARARQPVKEAEMDFMFTNSEQRKDF